MSGVPDDERPDPASVSTVEDLAVALKFLQICAGKPSVRDIARLTEKVGNRVRIPSSTIQDVLKGNRGLARRDVVLTIVEALGVADLALWQSAWNRVARARAGLPPVFVAPQGVPSLSVTRDGLDVGRIATANEKTAAIMIEAGDVNDVTHVLAGMDNHRAAYRLNKISPERVALVLAAMDERMAASIAEKMTQAAVAAAFETMPPDEAERVLTRISFDRRAAIMHILTSTTVAAILQQMPNWPAFLGDTQKLAPPDLVRFMAAMPPGSIADFFEHPSNNPRGARVIANLSTEEAARIIREVSIDQAVKWLATLQPNELVAAVRGLRDDEFVPILQRLPQNVVNGRGSQFIAAFGEAELVRLLVQLPVPNLGDWLGRLRGVLTTTSVNQLQKGLYQRQSSSYS